MNNDKIHLELKFNIKENPSRVIYDVYLIPADYGSDRIFISLSSPELVGDASASERAGALESVIDDVIGRLKQHLRYRLGAEEIVETPGVREGEE